MSAPRPYTLIAELTYKCPLRCTYCSNPVAFAEHSESLSTDAWLQVLGSASRLGVLQVHFTGGEPLLRGDLETLVQHARSLNLYSNLITSGVPVARQRLVDLATAGLDNVQLSFQDASGERAQTISGVDFHARKLEVARWVKELGLPLTINVVLHRHNLDHVAEVIALAESLEADRIELANTQYQGWAFENRQFLMPHESQLATATEIASTAKRRLEGKIEVLFVKPDYFGTFPRACMDGWAQRFVVVTPDGMVLPCHAAHAIKSLTFENVRARPLEAIWTDSSALTAFRGDHWMEAPCSGCERKHVDFGGCRCQAFQLTGSASETDPACSLSPDHDLIRLARESADPAVSPLYRLTTKAPTRMG